MTYFVKKRILLLIKQLELYIYINYSDNTPYSLAGGGNFTPKTLLSHVNFYLQKFSKGGKNCIGFVYNSA